MIPCPAVIVLQLLGCILLRSCDGFRQEYWLARASSLRVWGARSVPFLRYCSVPSQTYLEV